MINQNKFAIIYDRIFSKKNQDFEFYKYFIEKNNGPALEIGSGTGRLILQYLKLKLEVEGIEPNQEMTEICLKKETQIKPKIYHQALQNMNINKKFKTIYMPFFVFQHILETKEIINALKNVYEHLDNNGQVLISIFFPWNDPTGTFEQTWRISNIANDKDETIILSESIFFDKFEQIQTKYLKYEVFKNNSLKENYFSEIKLRCFSRFELTMLLEQLGFKNIEIFGDYLNQEAYSENDVYIFSAYKKV